MRFLSAKPKDKRAKRTPAASKAKAAPKRAEKAATKATRTKVARTKMNRTAAARASKSTRRPQRRPVPVFLKPRAILAASGFAAVMGVIAGGAWLWQSGWVHHQAEQAVEMAYQASADSGLRVMDLQVTGRQRTQVEAILSALEIERDMPILKIDPVAGRARLEALPWVRSAQVERQLPGVIFVTLEERQPLAIWQLHGDRHLIDRSGEIIPIDQVRRFAELPLVVGPGASAHAAGLIDLLASEPDLKERVSGAVWVSERRWNLQIDGDIEVQLPEENIDSAWRRLAEAEREHVVFTRDVKVIDMRLPDRFVVRTSPGAKPLTHPTNDEEST